MRLSQQMTQRLMIVLYELKAHGDMHRAARAANLYQKTIVNQMFDRYCLVDWDGREMLFGEAVRTARQQHKEAVELEIALAEVMGERTGYARQQSREERAKAIFAAEARLAKRLADRAAEKKKPKFAPIPGPSAMSDYLRENHLTPLRADLEQRNADLKRRQADGTKQLTSGANHG